MGTENEIIRIGPLLEHTIPAEECLLCKLTDMNFTNWHVIGERVVRGQYFVCDAWRYVLVGADGHTLIRHIDVTTEFLLEPGGHAEVMRQLATYDLGPLQNGDVIDITKYVVRDTSVDLYWME